MGVIVYDIIRTKQFIQNLNVHRFEKSTGGKLCGGKGRFTQGTSASVKNTTDRYPFDCTVCDVTTFDSLECL